MSHKSNQELDWLAFRYIADEMSVDEREAFEAQLAEDQQAREAVAGSVELAQTLAAAEHLLESPVVTSITRRANWWQRVAWLAIAGGVAACIALACALPALWQEEEVAAPHTSRGGGTAVSDPASKELASAWVATMNLDEQWQQESQDQDGAFAQPLGGDLLAVPEETPTAASDWMITALEGIERDLNREQNPDGEWEN